MLQAKRQTLITLRVQWLIVTLAYMTAILLGFDALPVAWHRTDNLQWLMTSSAVATVQLAILWWALPFNHPPNAQTLDEHSADGSALVALFGLANYLTIGRGVLVALLAGFVFTPMPWGWMAWLPAALYGTERIVDLFDGYVARVLRRESKLGAILDIEFDGLGILIASAVAVQYGKIPAWYLLLGVARPLFVVGMALRRQWGWKLEPLPASDLRRVIAGVQTAFVCVVLFPVLPAELTWLAAYIFAVPLVVSFARDWLIVSGTVPAADGRYLWLHTLAKRIGESFVPVAARAAGGFFALLLAQQWWGMAPMYSLLAIAMGVVALALWIGIASRAAAILLLLFLCLHVMLAGLAAIDIGLLVCCALVLHLGGGAWTLWSPEERFVRTPLGSQARE